MDLYSQGIQAFKDGMTELQIKSQHPVFRSGWRSAKADAEIKQASALDLKLQKVERFIDVRQYTVTWQDIGAVMRMYPFTNISSVPELEMLEYGMKQMVLNRSDKINSFGALQWHIGNVYLQIVEAAFKFKYIKISDFKRLGVVFNKNKLTFDQNQIKKVRHGD